MVQLLAACGTNEHPNEQPSGLIEDLEDGGPPKTSADPLPLPRDAKQLVERLGESHAFARARTGPHTLRCSVDINATPPTTREYPSTGGVVTVPISVHDTFELDYRLDPQEPSEGSPHQEAFRILQQDSRGIAREVRTSGERVFVRFHNRSWVHHAQDSALLENWLNDSYHCVFDVLSMVGPGLVIRRQAPTKTPSGSRVRYELGLQNDAPHAMAAPSTPAATDPQAWRAGAIVTQLSGTISFDPSTGIWDEASVNLELRARAREVRAASAEAHLQVRATLKSDASQPRWPLPEASVPMPSRRRLTHEAQTLLDGLARP